MGVDLTLIPVDCEMDNLNFGHSKLSLERRRELWDAIIEAKIAKPFGKPFSCYAGESYSEETEDCYGQSLTYALVNDLLKLFDHEGVVDNYTNRAIWAYLRELPANNKIILYWS